MMIDNKSYVAMGGSICPFCRSEDLTGGSFDVYGERVSQEVVCSDCGNTWFDNYRLEGYTPITETNSEE